MENMKNSTIGEYIGAFPPKTMGILKKLRLTINKAAPGAREVVSCGMPAFRLKKFLAYFAGHKGHVGFYPGAAVIQSFKKELTGFETSRGTVRFTIGEPVPALLIARIVKFKVRENSGTK